MPLNGRTSLGSVRLAAAAQDLTEVVVTGSRATEGRSNILTTAPVDVISAREIKASAQTEVAQILSYVTVGTGNLHDLLFDRQQQTRLESGNPRSKINLSASYSYGYGIFGIEARTVRFGEMQFSDANPARSFIDQTFAAKWITDLTLSAQIIKQVGLIVGVNNLFNVYPDWYRLNPRNDSTNFNAPPLLANGKPDTSQPDLSYNSTLDNTNRGRFVYNANQFGFQGAFCFTRVNVTLP